MRLAKLLARSGVASRRRAEEVVAAGRVTVAGEVVTDPALDVEEGSGEVAVDGATVSPERTETWMLNKPRGVVSTARDPGGRPTVVELVDSQARLYPVGRLDADSTGLILVTNDGELANRLTHPRYEVPRTYRAELRSEPTGEQLRRLARGVDLEDGPTAPAVARRAGSRAIELVVHEGRNRQIRRMAGAVGNEVVALRREAIGSLALGDLREGLARRLGEEEIARLWEDAGGDAEQQ